MHPRSSLERSTRPASTPLSLRSPAPPVRPHLWSVVLAGGEGTRMSSLVHRWLGRHVPKQYCRFTGTRSMLQHTISRADRVGDAGRRIIVSRDTHRDELIRHLPPRDRGTVLYQPENRGTAAAVLLALDRIRARDPNALVAIYPSDHFIHPEPAFTGVMARAVDAVTRFPDRALLLGVEPDGPETEYGWIQPRSLLGAVEGMPVRSVSAFREKPGVKTAAVLLEAGGVWNTHILVARASTLWELSVRHIPETALPLEGEGWSGASRALLQRVYADLPVRNLAEEVLQREPGRLAVMGMRGIGWSDWGRPERVVRSLRTIGREPAFPLELAVGRGRTPVATEPESWAAGGAAHA